MPIFKGKDHVLHNSIFDNYPIYISNASLLYLRMILLSQMKVKYEIFLIWNVMYHKILSKSLKILLSYAVSWIN